MKKLVFVFLVACGGSVAPQDTAPAQCVALASAGAPRACDDDAGVVVCDCPSTCFVAGKPGECVSY